MRATQEWATVALAALLGCGGTSQGEALTLEEAPGRFAEAACAEDYRCGGFRRLGIDFESVRRCEAAYGAFYQDFFAALQDQVDEGALAIDPAGLEACLAALDECGPEQGGELCTQAIMGLRETGEPCAQDAQCAPGNYCDLDRVTCEGACRETAKLGEACGAMGAECGVDLYCDLDTRTCQQVKAEGQPCSWGSECGYLACANVHADATELRCTSVFDLVEANLAQGAACSRDSGLCADGLHCIVPQGEDVGTCEPPFERDAACTTALPEACPADQYCDPVKGVCSDKLGMGEVCTGRNSCGPDMVCDAGRCRVMWSRSPGESCEADAECTSFSCDAGTCVEFLACTPR